MKKYLVGVTDLDRDFSEEVTLKVFEAENDDDAIKRVFVTEIAQYRDVDEYKKAAKAEEETPYDELDIDECVEIMGESDADDAYVNYIIDSDFNLVYCGEYVTFKKSKK